MNRKDILQLFDGTRDSFILEAIESRNQKRIPKSRYFLIAAAIALAMLLVGCGIVYALSLYRSPQEMISSLFGDQTGFDHKEPAYVEDPEKIYPPIPDPGFDRVPADTEAVEEVAPLVTVEGKTISLNGCTLTVDGFLYDSATQCGLVTFRLEGENGLPDFSQRPDGRIDLDLVRFNQYGYCYIIQDKSTEDSIAAAYYFKYDSHFHPTFSAQLYDDLGLDVSTASDQVMAEVKKTYGPEEAKAEAKAIWGEEYFENFVKQVQGYYDDVEAAYMLLRDDRLNHMQWGTESESIEFDCTRSSQLKNISVGGGILVSPISIQVNASAFPFLERAASDGLQGLSILFADGSEYILEGDGMENRMFALWSNPEGQPEGPPSQLTCMFNRIIDLDMVTAVKINGVELTKDPS